MQNPMSLFALRPHAVVKRVALLGVVVALFALVGVGTAVAAPPNRVLSDEVLRDSDSMSVAQIQAYLNTQPGPLKKLRTWDHDTTPTVSASQPNVNLTPDADRVELSAAQLIWDACQQWQINPKVMLAMLQKEQSLLTRTSVTKTTLARAIGAGCPNGTTNKYPGFGNQMWYGAKLLGGYGEGKNGSTIPLFYPGIVQEDIYKNPHVKVYPYNLATYKLYVYNPSISGNTSFWNIYKARFGNSIWPATSRSTTTRASVPSSVKARRTLKITGKVSYAAPGTVTISKSRRVGGKWKSMGSAQVTLVKGAYRYTFKPTSKGSWRIIVRYRGAETAKYSYSASNSVTKSVRVK
jgi:hypothetical protein